MIKMDETYSKRMKKYEKQHEEYIKKLKEEKEGLLKEIGENQLQILKHEDKIQACVRRIDNIDDEIERYEED